MTEPTPTCEPSVVITAATETNPEPTLTALCSCGWEQAVDSADEGLAAIRSHIPVFQMSWDAPEHP